jgi:hypothetical protein
MPARVIWNSTGADGYELECVYDQTFDGAEPDVLSRNRIRMLGKTWREVRAAGLTWSDYVSSSSDQYLIYRGPGEIFDISEENFEHLRDWIELHALDKNWLEAEAENNDWYAFERQELDETPHLFFKTIVPENKDFAHFRVHAYSQENGVTAYSPWLTSGEIPIQISIVKNDELLFNAVSGRSYDVQLSYEDIMSEFGNAAMMLSYDPARLSFMGLAPLDANSAGTGRIPVTVPQIISQTAGIIIIKCEKSEADCRNGLAALLRFTALADGETSVIIS